MTIEEERDALEEALEKAVHAMEASRPHFEAALRRVEHMQGILRDCNAFLARYTAGNGTEELRARIMSALSPLPNHEETK